MNKLVIIPSAMEAAMKRDLDSLRDSLPEDERPAFEAERHIHRQAIIDHYAEHGTYPEIGGIEYNTEDGRELEENDGYERARCNPEI